MEAERSPLEELADLVSKQARQGPRRYNAAFREAVELRELALRVLEDFDRRLRQVEEAMRENAADV